MCGRRVAYVIFCVLVTADAAAAADARGSSRSTSAFIPSYDWTGFFVGGHVGAGFSYRDWMLVDGSTSNAGDAVLLGGQLGANYQTGKWVIGTETALSWGNLKDESLCPDGNNTCWTRQNWLATVTGRIGYAFDPALFYLKGGAAFTHSDYFKTAQIPSPLDERSDGRRNGWTAGAGMEYALWRSWTMRLEYDYLEFGSRSFAMTNIASGAFAENLVVRQKAHEVKFGLNYLFNANNWTWAPQTKEAGGPSRSALVFRRHSTLHRSLQGIGRSAEAS